MPPPSREEHEAELDRQLAELQAKADRLADARPAAVRAPPFWLSHHHAEELDRTYKLGSIRLCARCLGVYPVLFAAIAAQLALRAPLETKLDGLIAVGLLLPALADWAFGRFRPHAFSNLWRTATGVMLGVALGRTLYVHLKSPLPVWLLVQAALVTAVAVPVIVATARRSRRRER